MSASYPDDPKFRHLFVRRCRNCDQEIDAHEYGPEKTCPHCGRISDPANIKQAHIVFGRNGYSNIDFYINGEEGDLALNVDYKKILLSYVLDVGDISDPPNSNEYWQMQHFGSVQGCVERVQRAIDELGKLDVGVELYLWAHQNDANCYLNMLYFSPLFLRFDKVYLVPTYTKEDRESDNYFPGDSLKRKRLLSKEELALMKTEFERASQGEYRIMRDAELLSYEEGDLDQIVLECMEKEFLFYNVLYSRVVERFKEKEKVFFPWDMFEKIMHRLLRLNLIESDGACEQWGDHCILLIERNFRIAAPQSRLYTEMDLLRILFGALAYGDTYSLYTVLAEDAHLFWDYGNESGKDRVVQRIEYVSRFLENYKREKIDCVLCTDEKENYSSEHVCVLWICEREEGKQFYVVRISVERNGIGEIVFSPPRPGTTLYVICEEEDVATEYNGQGDKTE